MSFFDQIFQKIFNNLNEKSITIKEVLKRNEKFQKEYNNWKEGKNSVELIEDTKTQYYYKKADISSNNNIILFSGRGSNGFAITYKKAFGKRNFQYLLEFFKENILKLGYTIQLAEFQMNDKNNFVESKEKYYLKANFRNQRKNLQICNQLYGNVLLEHILVDNKPSHIKILVNYYQDSLFTKVLDFDDLVEAIFKY